VVVELSLFAENILHRDLKSLNVLLDDRYRAKLCDFGLAKVKTETSSSTKNEVAGTLAWMAPELFKRKAIYTKKADIYSYGMVLWEIAARQLPYQDANGNQALISKWVSEGEREEIPDDTPPKLASLIKFCWEAEPDKRPSAEQVVIELKSETATAEASPMSGPSYREAMRNALTIAESLVEHAIVAFGLIGIDQTTEDAKTILHWIKKRNEHTFTKSDVVFAMRNKKLGKSERLAKTLHLLNERNIISSPIQHFNRKPTTVYYVNPILLAKDKGQ
jgi:serine/threonine protein kinase